MVPEKIKHEGDDEHDKIVYILKKTRDIKVWRSQNLRVHSVRHVKS